MKISAIRIENLKCFRDTNAIELGRNWTAVIGQNNAGKSTLLAALQITNFRSVPYRGFEHPADFPPNPNSRITFRVELTGKELQRTLLTTGQAFHWSKRDFVQIPESQRQALIDRMSAEFFEKGALTVDGYVVTAGFQGFTLKVDSGLEIFPWESYFRIYPKPERDGFLIYYGNDGANDAHIANWFVPLAASSIYRFSAERMHIGVAPVDKVTVLKDDGSNLAQVLLILKEDDAKFREFFECVQFVLPNVTGIVPTILSSVEVAVDIQFHDLRLDRGDLNIRLGECGTGTSQVLCLLYVVVTSKYPRVIIIDEPNSFLHPGAAKRLIGVLKRYSKHQFIIATHSPELIEVSDPDRLLQVRWLPSGSVIDEVKRTDVVAMRSVLGDLGSALSDVFGLEKVVWVEGQTEAICFPILLKATGKMMSAGLGFVPLRAVGDITGAEKVGFLQIYRNLATHSRFLPAAVAFSLDSERLTETQKDDLIREADGKLYFLPRRCLENFFLHKGAISALFASIGEQVSADEVQEFLVTKAAGLPLEVWAQTCDGAKVIQEMFSQFTDKRYRYSKTAHGQWLVEWLIQNDRDSIRELERYVMQLVEAD